LIKRTSIVRWVSRDTLPVTLLTLMLSPLLLLSISLVGCTGKPSSTPTPTKTSTPPPLETPSPTPTQLVQAATRAPANAQDNPQRPTPTSTLAPTETPTPQAPISRAQVLLAQEPEDVETILSIKPISRASTRPSTQATTQEATESTPLPPAQPVSQDTGSGTEINPLTGLRVSVAKLNRRPLGVKVPNFPFDARPQSGLSRADVVIEHEAEAYLTRFTAIFLGNDAGQLGPVRSLRLPDAELMSIFKSTLVASGGHPAVKIRITEGKAWAAGYKRIICPEPPFLGDGSAMQRMPQLKSRFELTMYSDTTSLWNVSTQRGINQRQDFHGMWVFDESPPAGGRAANHLKIIYKPTWSEAEYRYDGGIHAYRRYDVGQPTVDALTGQQIAPSNVLVLYVNHADSDILADAHDPQHPWYAVLVQLWGEGTGKLLRDGQVYDIKWVRENPQQPNDRLVFLDGQGQQIALRPGPSWIQLVRPDANVQID
jgi:hypothetical protein